MKHKAYAFVQDQNDERGVIEISQFEDKRPEIEVLLAHSQHTLVPADKLILQNDGTYLFPDSFVIEQPEEDSSDRLVIPVIVEELKVDKRWVETGRIRVEKHVNQEEAVINELLTHEQVEMKRVPINQIITEMPQVRHDEEKLIIPIVEEELVVEKRLRLEEEVVVRKDVQERTETVNDTVRRKDVEVENTSGNGKSYETYSPEFHTHYQTTYAKTGQPYEYYDPAYRYGYNLASNPRYYDYDWNRLESEARTNWEAKNPNSWERFKDAIRHGWEQVKEAVR